MLAALTLTNFAMRDDSTLQFIQLVDITPNQLAGMALTTSHDGVTQTFTFPASSRLATLPRTTDYLLIVSQSLSLQRNSIEEHGADYVMPDGFLPLSGGTISLGSIDGWDYGSIPTDGYSAVYRSGGIGVHRAHSSAYVYVVSVGSGDERFVKEYSSGSLARHFITTIDAEIAALDWGRIPGWHPIYRDYPTGYTGFLAHGRRFAVASHAVCRFYLPPPHDSHFFTASEEECAEVQVRYPQFILETDNAFYAGLPDPVTGRCAPGLGPLFRLWNPASNDHWYTADVAARSRAISEGYFPEGYGEPGDGMCVLPVCVEGCGD